MFGKAEVGGKCCRGVGGDHGRIGAGGHVEAEQRLPRQHRPQPERGRGGGGGLQPDRTERDGQTQRGQQVVAERAGGQHRMIRLDRRAVRQHHAPAALCGHRKRRNPGGRQQRASCRNEIPRQPSHEGRAVLMGVQRVPHRAGHLGADLRHHRRHLGPVQQRHRQPCRHPVGDKGACDRQAGGIAEQDQPAAGAKAGIAPLGGKAFGKAPRLQRQVHRQPRRLGLQPQEPRVPPGCAPAWRMRVDQCHAQARRPQEPGTRNTGDARAHHDGVKARHGPTAKTGSGGRPSPRARQRSDTRSPMRAAAPSMFVSIRTPSSRSTSAS